MPIYQLARSFLILEQVFGFASDYWPLVGQSMCYSQKPRNDDHPIDFGESEIMAQTSPFSQYSFIYVLSMIGGSLQYFTAILAIVTFSTSFSIKYTYIMGERKLSQSSPYKSPTEEFPIKSNLTLIGWVEAPSFVVGAIVVEGFRSQAMGF